MAWLSVSGLWRWRIVLAFVCCLTAYPGLAADKPTATSTAARPTKFPKCCVWRVTNAKAPFYLVGSIHSLSSRDYPLPSPYEMALNESKRIVFEYDPNRDDEFQAKFADAGKYPPGQDIRSKIHPRTLAWQRFVGTAVGAVLGAALATFFHATVIVYAAGVILCGALSFLLRVEGAYRFAAITLSIILLIPRASAPWIVGWHRFLEVSLGVGVALAVTTVWPLTKGTR